MATPRARIASPKVTAAPAAQTTATKPERSRSALLGRLRDELALPGGYPSPDWPSDSLCRKQWGLPAWFGQTAQAIYAHLLSDDADRWLLAVHERAPLHTAAERHYRALTCLRIDRLRLLQLTSLQVPSTPAFELVEQSIAVLDGLRTLVLPLEAEPALDLDVSLLGNAAFTLVQAATDAGADRTVRVARAAYAMAGGLFNICAANELGLTVAALSPVEGSASAWQRCADDLLTVVSL